MGLARALVLRGSKQKTVGGLTKNMLMKNKRGKIVSRKSSANGKRRYANVEAWVEAHMQARAALKVSGFVSINGKSIQGKALYVKTKAVLAAKRTLGAAASASAASPARAAVASPARVAAAEAAPAP